MFRWIVIWMASQVVSRCASDDASACILMPISVRMRPNSGDVEGGEPMMIMLRCSELVVMLASGVLARIDLR